MIAPEPTAARIAGDKLLEMAQRLTVADKFSPGCAAQFHFAVNGKSFEVTLRAVR